MELEIRDLLALKATAENLGLEFAEKQTHLAGGLELTWVTIRYQSASPSPTWVNANMPFASRTTKQAYEIGVVERRDG